MLVSRRLPAAMQPALVAVFMTAIVISAPGQNAYAQHVIYVNASAAGTNDGTNWQDAFDDLQDALAISVECDEIWVAAGTYTPDRGTGDRTLAFDIPSGVALYGGFAGWETQRPQRNWDQNETILSGDLNGDDGPRDCEEHSDCCYEHEGVGCDDATCAETAVLTYRIAARPVCPSSAGTAIASLRHAMSVAIWAIGTRATTATSS